MIPRDGVPDPLADGESDAAAGQSVVSNGDVHQGVA
jgi:hypothetical protein